MEPNRDNSAAYRLVRTVQSSSRLVEQLALLNHNLVQLRERLMMLDASLQAMGQTLGSKAVPGLSDREISELPLVQAEGEVCGVCLEAVTDPATQLPCTHRFHLNCFSAWGKLKAECPNCRQRLK